MFSLFSVGYFTMSLKDGGEIGSGGTSVTCYDEFKISDLELKTWCLDCRVKRGAEFKLESHCNR